MQYKNNPLSPHLQIYKWQISSLLSIAHRIVGVINIIAITAICIWSLLLLLGILLLFSWVSLVGVVRAEFLRARNFEYVEAARALGVPDLQIMWRHLLPNAIVATLTLMPFVLNASISTLTSLDFLGFGLPPGSPSLGELLEKMESDHRKQNQER